MNDYDLTKNIIEINDLDKAYQVGGNDVPVLKGLSLTVEPGEFMAITGPSGNGKSTLLNMITGIDRPTAGQVIVNGSPVHEMSENQLAKWRGENLGIIFQFFQLLPSLSLQQNVVMPMEFARKFKRRERRERAMDLLEMVGLADQAHKLPGMVSGGQQQRAAIARALANDPPLLIADEPTGNLDSKTTKLVMKLFEQFNSWGTTIIIATHDEAIYRRAEHRVIELHSGRFVTTDKRTMKTPTNMP